MNKLICVGGEHEGMTTGPLDSGVLKYTFFKVFAWEKEETYVRISAKGEGDFFMLEGMVPADALKRWRELTARPEPS